MASKRSAFARHAEIMRCVHLIDHYADQGWPKRCDVVFAHLLRLWRMYDNRLHTMKDVPVTRRWYMAKALARQRNFHGGMRLGGMPRQDTPIERMMNPDPDESAWERLELPSSDQDKYQATSWPKWHAPVKP